MLKVSVTCPYGQAEHLKAPSVHTSGSQTPVGCLVLLLRGERRVCGRSRLRRSSKSESSLRLWCSRSQASAVALLVRTRVAQTPRVTRAKLSLRFCLSRSPGWCGRTPRPTHPLLCTTSISPFASGSRRHLRSSERVPRLTRRGDRVVWQWEAHSPESPPCPGVGWRWRGAEERISSPLSPRNPSGTPHGGCLGPREEGTRSV